MNEVAARGIDPVPSAGSLAWSDTLPWHGWWLYPSLAILLFVWGHGILWASGRLQLGSIEPTVTVSVVYLLSRLIGGRLGA